MDIIDQIISESAEAIHHYDDTKAKKLLKEVLSFLMSKNIQEKDPELSEKLQKILIYLKLVAIPQLSDEETVEVLQNNYLDSFDAEIDIENRLTVKLFFVPEIPRDELRKKLKKALMENNQKLGQLTIGQWIKEFEKEYNIRTRTLSASVDFIRSNRNASLLDPILRNRLKEFIHTYDYLLVTTLPATGPALNNFLSSDPNEKNFEDFNSEERFNSSQYSSRKNTGHYAESESFKEIKIEELPINTAIQKYPELGEQLITPNYIKLKVFPEPVRPSIKNWLSDYTFNIGISNHDPIVRGNYLFKNENARKLSQQDRDKLSQILKSFEEKTPLAVNTNTRQVVFSAMVSQKRPTTKPSFTHSEKPQTFQTDEERLSAWRKNLPSLENKNNKQSGANNIRFSSPQTLPAEKPAIKNNFPAERPAMKNVVDLREE